MRDVASHLEPQARSASTVIKEFELLASAVRLPSIRVAQTRKRLQRIFSCARDTRSSTFTV